MADKFRRKKEPRHVRLYHSITGCDAWRDLSGNAIKVLIALARYDDGDSNGALYFSERRAAHDTGLSRNTVRRALAELIEKGFIAQTKPGAFNRNNLMAATYRLTWVAWPGGKPAHPTRDFEKWVSNRPNGNSQAQVLTATGSNIDHAVETHPPSGADIEPLIMETRPISVDPSMSDIEPQVSYQGDRSSALETGQRKQANPLSRAFPSILRDALIAHLSDAEPGTQSQLADRIGCPPGTLSKFIGGRNLPEPYRAPLASLVMGQAA